MTFGPTDPMTLPEVSGKSWGSSGIWLLRISEPRSSEYLEVKVAHEAAPRARAPQIRLVRRFLCSAASRLCCSFFTLPSAAKARRANPGVRIIPKMKPQRRGRQLCGMRRRSVSGRQALIRPAVHWACVSSPSMMSTGDLNESI